MSRKKPINRRRTLWHQQKGRCFWCGRLTVLEDPPRNGGAPPKKNVATLDHLRSRYRSDRVVPVQEGEQRLVMACWECNNNRGARETESIAPQELTRRAKAGLARKQQRRKGVTVE